MKAPVSWLADLVDIPVAPDVLAEDLHMAGFEVAGMEAVPGGQPPADVVIDFEITANRPDCLSMIGLAREIATKYGTALRRPAAAGRGTADGSRLGPLTVHLDDEARCRRYCAAIADVAVGPSPAWLAARLASAGIRSISNIVDVTNYVLLELGHPLHAFDIDRLAGPQLRIRAARDGEALTTLDGQARALSGDMLVIADAERAQALAGVMGGRDSEVTGATRTIVLESAWFDPISIRRTSRRLGLSTEASYRFERGADYDAAASALWRACTLIEEIGAGTARAGWIDARREKPPQRRVTLAYARVAALLGVEVPPADVRRILTGLGFEPAADTPEALAVTAPSWRSDVARDVDLVEEIARHYGYDRLPVTFPPLRAAPPAPHPRLERDRAVRRLATSAGFTEAVTFSFISEKAAAGFAGPDTLVPLTNPLSELFAVLRPSLLPGLVDAVAHNRRHGLKDVRLFELGTRFVAGAGEVAALGLAWSGAALPEHWSQRPRPADLFDLSGVIAAIGEGLGLDLTLQAGEHLALTPGRSAVVAVATPQGPRACGVAGRLRTELATARDVPAHDDVFVAELDLDAMADRAAEAGAAPTQPLPRFPSIVRDVSILIDERLLAADVRGTIQAAAPPTLARAIEFDRYQGKGIAEGKVSLSYRLTFQAADRTLTDAEADEAMQAIVGALEARHGAVRR